MNEQPQQQPPAEDEDAPPIGWTPTTLEDAEFCLKRLGAAQAELAEYERLFEWNVQQLKAQHEKFISRAKNREALFSSYLKAYAEENKDVLLKGGRKKSRELYNGTLGWRSPSPGLEVKDDAALLAWAKEQPEELGLVRTKEEPAVAKIQEHFKATGEVPPGTEPRPDKDVFYAKPSNLPPAAEAQSDGCQVCGSAMVTRNGRNGRFLGCSRYPDCRSTRPLHGDH
jgi:phage host-nuclease inhibitor protein Gam